MKIYTRTGDAGQTGLFGGGRVAKDDPRVAAYGEVDELNAVIGVARAAGLGELDPWCQDLQDQLFTVGAVLATPRGTRADSHIPHVREEWVGAMESRIDELQARLPPQTHFILPGGTPGSAALHLARTVCRRAERSIVPLFRDGQVDELTLRFLNRLSDFLFVLARAANHRAGVKDVPWIPGGTPSP
ncbi:MAG TPA: cob(I)yrinic acid a,c-diamide adenosyltransferase [Myxococcaceae bacterium]|nr:cob(I)yrinic acid a,c-diamide adenosyltransferase [Myxococcaceae bacterium]